MLTFAGRVSPGHLAKTAGGGLQAAFIVARTRGITTIGAFVMLAALAACAGPAPTDGSLVLLTRADCVNTATMRANLDEALLSLQPAMTYDVIDLDTLPSTDVHQGYPTPTLLYANRDVFGLAEPRPPLPEPT